MSYRNYACSADTVSTEFVKKMCPKEFKDLTDILDEYDISLDVFAKAVEFDDFIGEKKMYLLKFENDDNLANIKVGAKYPLIEHVMSMFKDKGKDISFHNDGKVTYIQQNGNDIGMIIEVELVGRK